jgi:diguanylate cyclase (GGDEF)-like protein/PAS domain S-box-containing protein
MTRQTEIGDERQRLATLRRFAILDTPDEEVFDRVTRLVARLFDVPIALITLIDETRQWFKSRYGIDVTETQRALAFCEYAIRGDEVMVVPDMALDARFRNNAFVLGDPKIRFYAGAPLIASDGTKVGTVCVLDSKPRTLNETQLEVLEQMSTFVMAHFEMRLEMLQTQAAKNELAAVIETSPSAVITGRVDGTITGWNAAASRIFGWTSDEVLGRPRSFVPAEFEAEAQQIRTRVIEGGEIVNGMRAQGLHKSGKRLEVSLSARPIYDAAGVPVGAAYVVEDLAESNRAKRIERRRFEVLELAANDAPIDEILQHLVENVEYSVPGSIAMISRLRGDRLFHVASGRDLPAPYVNAIEGVMVGPNEGSCGAAAFRGESIIAADIAHDPLWKTYKVVALAYGLRSCWSAPIRNGHNVVLGTLALYSREVREPAPVELRFVHEAAHVASIAMEAHEARQKLEDMALTDPLTELPNRHAFERRLNDAIDSSQRTHKRFALGLLDLNRFKIVNDSLGHAAGDQLIREIANRLERSLRPQDMLARMGSDEFLLLIADIDNREMADTIARRVASMLDASFMPGNHEVFVRATIGLSIYPDDSREPSQLMRLADMAMYGAKARGDTIAFYTGPQRRDGLTRLALEASLNHALENNEFELHYQPQILVKTSKIFGAEALIRWNHPKLGRIMPDAFIKLAEETGLIVSIGAWVVREACRFGRRWLDAGGPGIVSVNVSPRQFESASFVDVVASALVESRFPPSCLWLEITESLIMRSPETAAAIIADLRAMGVRSFIDDFGTGYSSLNHLRRFPVDGLKIDQVFMRDIGGPHNMGNDVTLVRAIIGVGRAMNLSIVAEGVETQAQHDFLAAHDCEIAQGYLYARPMPEAEMLTWRSAPHL